ncbi:MAG: hypothetical protein ACI9MC_001084, partial [Kiritimatiellia bacterium]
MHIQCTGSPHYAHVRIGVYTDWWPAVGSIGVPAARGFHSGVGAFVSRRELAARRGVHSLCVRVCCRPGDSSTITCAPSSSVGRFPTHTMLSARPVDNCLAFEQPSVPASARGVGVWVIRSNGWLVLTMAAACTGSSTFYKPGGSVEPVVDEPRPATAFVEPFVGQDPPRDGPTIPTGGA